MHKIGKKGLFAFAVSLMLALLVSAAVLSVSAPSARRAVFADEQAQGNVAEVNGTQYATVKEAFENAPEDGVVTLIADATHTATTATGEDGNKYLSNSITVTKSLTFDLNGHTFAVSLPGKVYSAIYVEGGGTTFTLKDGAGNGKLTSEDGYGVSASDGAMLVVESGTIDSLTSALSSNNTTGVGNFTVKDGTLSAAQGPAIYMPAQGKLTITGGTLNGGVIARMGKIEISGGTLIAPTVNLDPIEEYYNFSGNVWLGGALTVMAGTYKFDDGNELAVNITGGKFVNEFDPATYSEGSTTDASQFANAINVYMQGKSAQEIAVNVSPEAEFEVASGKTVAFTEVETYVESLGGEYEYKGSTPPVTNTPVYNGQQLAVAEGATGYGYSADTTLQDLIASANGNTVTLFGDTAQSITIPEGTTVTLDLNGYTLTNEDAKHTITNNGNLTVIGNGTVDNVSHAHGALVNYGTAVLNGGTYTRSLERGISGSSNGNSWYVIYNEGDSLTINKGTTVIHGTTEEQAASARFSSLIINTNRNEKTGTITINGGVFRTGLIAVKNEVTLSDGNGLTINGGEFYAEDDQSVQSWGSTLITGGIFHGAVLSWSETGTDDMGNVTVKGGTFKNEVGSRLFQDNKVYYYTNGTTIENGNFAVIPYYTYLKEGFVIGDYDETTGTYGVADGKYVAVVNYGFITARAYLTLQEAIDASASDEDVTLLDNITENITIAEGATVTLNLNGYKITNASDQTNHTIVNCGTLTVKGNGTVDNVSEGWGALVNHGTAKLLSGTYTKSANSWYVLKNYGTMEIGENAQSQITVIKDDIQSSLIANGWDCPKENPTDLSLRAKLTIYGGQFEGGMHTVKNDGFGELLIKDGTFVGKAKITVLSYNKLTIEGGNFTGKQVVATYNGVDGSSPDLASVITGGHFDGTIDNHTGKYCYEISGGTFTQVPSPSLMAEGFCIGVGENGEFIADKNDDYVANKNNISYKTLQAAIDADGTTVVYLKKDLSEEITVPTGKSVIINLNGHTLSASENSKKVVTVEGTLTLKNGSIVSGYASDRVVYVKGGNLKIEGDVTINRTVVGSYDLIYVSNGTLTVSGENNVFGDQNHTFYNGTATNRYLIYQENSQIILGGSAAYYGGRYVVYTKSDKNASSSLTITGGTFLAYEGKDLFSVPTSGEYTFSVTGGTFNRMIDANDMPVNTVCCRENELFSVAVLTAEIENIVSGISEAEFAWTAIADGYAYIAENGVYTVVGAETYSAWAKEQVENHVARLLAKNNYSEGAAAKINAYAQNAYAVIENTTAGTAENNEKIERAVYTAIREADSVPTVNAEFAETLAEAKAEVKLYAATKGVVYTDEMEECFADATAQTLDNAKAQAIAMVDAAAKAAADQAAEEAAKAEAEKALADAKKNAVNELNLYASLKGVELKDEWTTAINEATDIQAVETALANAETAIDEAAKAAADQAAEEAAQAEAEKALADAKKNAISELKLYASLKGVELKDEWTTAIDEATDIQAVETALASAETAIDEAAKAAEDQAAEEAAQAEAEKALADAKKNAINELNLYASLKGVELKDEWTTAIDDATQIQAVETALANAETAIDDAAKAAADQAAEEAAQAEAEKALAEAIANAKAEVKFYAATKSIEYTAEMDACFNEVTSTDEVAAAKEEAFKLARAAAALIPDNSVDETDIANAKADLEKWLNSYLDELVGGKVSVQNAEAFAQIGIILAQAEEETDLKTRLLKTYSEENAEKIVGYYEEALAALDAAETNADVQLAVLNFKVSVLGVEKVSDNAGMSGGEISVIVLLVLIVLMIVAVLAIVLKGRKSGSAEKTEKRRN